MSATQLAIRPSNDHGVLVGQGTWRFVVEALLPSVGDSLWGKATWNNGVTGNAIWSTLDWIDLTKSVRGLQWTRGSEGFAGRPVTGTASITLGVINGSWSPLGSSTSATYFAPGTVIRIACIDPTTSAWIPQFAGTVESWPQRYTSAGYDATIELSVVETPAFLASIDDNTTTSQGAGEPAYFRVFRLTKAAESPWGLNVEAFSSGDYGLQATDMSANRLAECHLTADSSDLYFTSHRSGVYTLRRADPRERPEWPVYQNTDPSGGRDVVTRYPQGICFQPQGAARAGSNYALDTTEYLSIPDAANLDFVGDFAAMVEVDSFAAVGAGVAQQFVGKWTSATGTQAWMFGIFGFGATARNLYLQVRKAAATQSFVSVSQAGGVGRVRWAVTYDNNNGSSVAECRFWYQAEGAAGWTELDAFGLNVVGPVAATQVTAQPVTIGSAPSGVAGVATTYYRVKVWDHLNASNTMPSDTPVLEVSPGDAGGSAITSTSFTVKSGQTATIVGTGVLAAAAPLVIDGNDPFEIANDLDVLQNDVRLTAVGGTQQAATDAMSIGRWKRRATFARNDLITNTDAGVLDIATKIKNRRSNVTLRPTSLTVLGRPGQPDSNMPALFSIDVGDRCFVSFPGGAVRTEAAVSSATHSVAVLNGSSLFWRAVFGFDVFSEATG